MKVLSSDAQIEIKLNFIAAIFCQNRKGKTKASLLNLIFSALPPYIKIRSPAHNHNYNVVKNHSNKRDTVWRISLTL